MSVPPKDFIARGAAEVPQAYVRSEPRCADNPMTDESVAQPLIERAGAARSTATYQARLKSDCSATCLCTRGNAATYPDVGEVAE